MQHVEFTQGVGKSLVSGGEQALVNVHGSKFVKKLKWFILAVAKAKKVSDIIEKRQKEEELLNREYDIVLSADAMQEGVVIDANIETA